MHPYSSDARRRNILWMLAVLSVVVHEWVGAPLRSEVEFLADGVGIPPILIWTVTRLLSPLGVFAILHLMFDRLFWRILSYLRVGVVRAPNLNGKWRGYLKSSHDEFQKQHRIEVQISQTWSKISIRLKTSKSASVSHAASFILRDNLQPRLVYTYQNDPKYHSVGPLQIHKGTAEFVVKSQSRLTGNYYTDPGREGNYGTIELQKC